MGSSVSSGENRAKEAIVAALDFQMIIKLVPKTLLLIVSGTNEIIDEIGEINDHIQAGGRHAGQEHQLLQVLITQHCKYRTKKSYTEDE
jgi:hypothetical protein